MFKQFLRDEKGAVTTVEIMGYTVLIGGMTALVGYGLTSMARGKTSDFTGDVKDLKAVSKTIPTDGSADYTAGTTTSGDTGMVTDSVPAN